MSKEIKLNIEQSLYVIPCGEGYSCLGFENARKHCEQIAQSLNRSDLMPTPEIFGTLKGYGLYEHAVKAWASSLKSKKTYFDPGTEKKVQAVLEKYRQSQQMVRLFYGDPSTGRDSCEELDVVGQVGRSGGSMKVPLLLVDGENYGSPISSDRLLRIMDVRLNVDVYRHKLYQVPDIQIVPLVDPGLPDYKWAGHRDGVLVARFRSTYEAAEWQEFMTGRIACKREDVVNNYKLAA